MNVTEKLDKEWGHLVFMFPSWVMAFKLPKKVHFLHFCVGLSKKSVKAIYLDISERSCFALSENDIVYYAIWYDLVF